ncbi:MAG: flavin reductase family protein [Pirellulales bacterium]|nr:flavin reductase family protein [Pirellulales bacterium]
MKKSLGADTLIYPTPAWVVGTYDKEGKPNLATSSWGGICCSQPPCLAISFRKATYSYGNIVERKAFTVSVPSVEQLDLADYCGLVSGRSVDKFAVCKLTPVRGDAVDAPYPQEFPMVLECRLLHTLEIGLHTQFVGEILDVKVEESALDADGQPTIEKVRPILFSPRDRKYHGVGKFLGKAFEVGRGLMKK